jgi:hypothetical protein
MPRVRSVSSMVRVADLIQSYQGSPDIWRGLGGEKGQLSVMSDNVTPGYRKLRSRGVIVMNPMTLTRTTYENSGDALWEVNDPGGWGVGSLKGDALSCAFDGIPGGGSSSNGVPHIDDGWQQRARDNALIKAYSTMNSSPVMGGEILSEVGKSVNMLRHPFKSAVSLIWDIRRRKSRLIRSGLTAARASAQAWLEYRYGWKPLILDSIEIMRSTMRIATESREGFRVARGSAKDGRTYAIPYDAPIIGGAWRVAGMKTGTAEIAAHAGILYKQAPSSVPAEISRTLGLDARSIPGTLWELTPYSFVVDWFVGVGPWIEAVMPRSDISVISSWLTTVEKSSADFPRGTLTRTVGIPPKTYVGHSNSAHFSWVTVQRVVDPSLSSTPVMTGKFPSLLHQVDATALLLGSITKDLKAFRH